MDEKLRKSLTAIICDIVECTEPLDCDMASTCPYVIDGLPQLEQAFRDNGWVEPQQPGINERRTNSLYATNTTAAWAKAQLRILHDMLDDRNTGVIKTPLSMSWIAQEINRIETGIQLTG